MRLFQFFEALPCIEPVGWMLLQSVWLIGLIAAAYALADVGLRRRSANARYLAGCAALLASLAALPVAFWMAPASVTSTRFTQEAAGRSTDRRLLHVVVQERGRDEPPTDERQVAARESSQRMADLQTEVIETESVAGASPSSIVDSVSRWVRIEAALRPWLPGLVECWLAGVLLLRDVKQGTKITADLVGLGSLPINDIPSDTLFEERDFLGRVANEDLNARAPIRERQLTADK